MAFHPIATTGAVLRKGAALVTAPIRHPVRTALVVGGTWAAAKGLPEVSDHWHDVFGNDPPQALKDVANGFGYVWEVEKGVGHFVVDKVITPTEEGFHKLMDMADAHKGAPTIPTDRADQISQILGNPLIVGDTSLANVGSIPSTSLNSAKTELIKLSPTVLTAFAKALEDGKKDMPDDPAARRAFKAEKIATAAGEAAGAGADRSAILGSIAGSLDALSKSDSAASDENVGVPLWRSIAVIREMIEKPTTAIADLETTKHPETADEAYKKWKAAHDTTAATATTTATKPAEPKLEFHNDDPNVPTVLSTWRKTMAGKESEAAKLQENGSLDFYGLQADGVSKFRVLITANKGGTYTVQAGASADGSKFDGDTRPREFSSLDGVFKRLNFGMDGIGPAENLSNYLATEIQPRTLPSANMADYPALRPYIAGPSQGYFGQPYAQPTPLQAIAIGIGGALALPFDVARQVVQGVGALVGARPYEPGSQGPAAAAYGYPAQAQASNPYDPAIALSEKLRVGDTWNGRSDMAKLPMNGSRFSARRNNDDNYTVTLENYGPQRAAMSLSVSDQRMKEYLNMYSGYNNQGASGPAALEQAVAADWQSDPRNAPVASAPTSAFRGNIGQLRVSAATSPIVVTAGSSHEHLTTAQLNERSKIASRNAAYSVGGTS